MVKINYDREYFCDEDMSVLYEKHNGISIMRVKEKLIEKAENRGYKLRNDDRRASGLASSYSNTIYYGHPDERISIAILAHEVGHVICEHNLISNYPYTDYIPGEIEAWEWAFNFFEWNLDFIPDFVIKRYKKHINYLISKR